MNPRTTDQRISDRLDTLTTHARAVEAELRAVRTVIAELEALVAVEVPDANPTPEPAAEPGNPTDAGADERNAARGNA